MLPGGSTEQYGGTTLMEEAISLARGATVLQRTDSQVHLTSGTTADTALFACTSQRQASAITTLLHGITTTTQSGLEELLVKASLDRDTARQLIGELLEFGVLSRITPPSVVGVCGKTELAAATTMLLEALGCECKKMRAGEQPRHFIRRLDPTDTLVLIDYTDLFPSLAAEVKHWGGTCMSAHVVGRQGTVGPIVHGKGTCLYCYMLNEVAHDPHWFNRIKNAEIRRRHQDALTVHATASRLAAMVADLVGASPTDSAQKGVIRAKAGMVMSIDPYSLATPSWQSEEHRICPECWDYKHKVFWYQVEERIAKTSSPKRSDLTGPTPETESNCVASSG